MIRLTSSSIGYRTAALTVHAIGCAQDGYPEYNGKVLLEHYDYDKTMDLVYGGSIESLGQEITEHVPPVGPGELFNREKYTVFYKRDLDMLSEEDPGYHFNNVEEWVNQSRLTIQYFYIVEPDNTWLMFVNRTKRFMRLYDYLSR